ncbi:MAG: BLUF domain-containing protein [Geminicoccaceae bacterium]
MSDEFGFPSDPDYDATAPTLYNFVYCSRAADGVDDAEVDRLVESAQRHNLTAGITGVLVFGSGVFFQWIEGPAGEVRTLIASLHGDPRHYDIVSLDQGEENRERLYPNWQMERVGADDIRDVLEDALESAKDEHNVAALKRILDHLATRSLDTLGRPN